jgi:hypothetical protein
LTDLIAYKKQGVAHVDRGMKDPGKQHGAVCVIRQPGEQNGLPNNEIEESRKACPIGLQAGNHPVGEMPAGPQCAEDETGSQPVVTQLQVRHGKTAPADFLANYHDSQKGH